MAHLKTLKLTNIESNELVSVLESFMTEFRIEIGSVEKHEWQRELENDEIILKNVLCKLRKMNQL